RSPQILRCGIYCADLEAWLGLLFVAMALSMYVGPGGSGAPIGALTAWQVWMLVAGGALSLAVYLVISIRVAFAFRSFLHLRHAIATAVLVQIVIILALAVFQLPFD